MSRFVLPVLASLAACSGDANHSGDEGLRKCEAGMSLIASTELHSVRADLEPDERRRVRADLEAGTALILDGFLLLGERFLRTGRTFDAGPAEKSLRAARYRLWRLDQ